MNNDLNNGITLTIDVKKNRIRIYKATIHALGDPGAVELLINPCELKAAIRAVHNEVNNYHAHKIRQNRLASDASYEIYSKSFILEVCSLVSNIDFNASYRMKGAVLSQPNCAVFDLKTLHRIED